jgi:hypothetical protein
MRCNFILPMLLMILLATPAVSAQTSSALINEAMDKRLSLELSEVPLDQAMRLLTEETGVPLTAKPSVWELLPWGEQTTITAQIENQTLRAALEAITRKLGLTFVLQEEAIELRPVPALSRLGRRSTLVELNALELLARNPIALDTDQPTMRQLLNAIDERLIELQSPYAIEHRARETVSDDQAIFVPRNATMMSALESIARETGATWYPWGETLLIVSKEDLVRRQLARTITTRFEGVDVGQVLTDLSQRSGVSFTIEPGALQRIPAEFRTIRMVLDNATITQALENLAGVTGLGYVVRPDGIYIWNQMAMPSPAPRDPVIAMLPLPDLNLQVPLPESQVPPDLREYIRHKQQQEMHRLRQMMEEEGFVPSQTAGQN